MNPMVSKIIISCIFLFFASNVYANEVQNIDNQELKKLMEQGVAVIDVRATSEWNKTGIVKDSHQLMFYDDQGKYDLNVWLANVAEIANKDEPIVLICHSGGRTKQLAKYLTSVVGYKKVYNVKRGIAHWIKKKNTVVRPN